MRGISGAAHSARSASHRVIAGREEARMIYLAWHTAPETRGNRLVLDIGGGSTELIVGKVSNRCTARAVHGLREHERRALRKGAIKRAAFAAAEPRAHQNCSRCREICCMRLEDCRRRVGTLLRRACPARAGLECQRITLRV